MMRRGVEPLVACVVFGLGDAVWKSLCGFLCFALPNTWFVEFFFFFFFFNGYNISLHVNWQIMKNGESLIHPEPPLHSHTLTMS